MKQFISRHKIYFILFAICLIVAIGSGVYLRISNFRFQPSTRAQAEGNAELEKKQNVNLKSKIKNLQLITSTPQQVNTQTLITYNLKPKTSTEPEFKNPITLKINNEEYKLEYQENQSVYEFMQALSADSKKPFIFATKEYPGMGHFVESINGAANDAQVGKYWLYYINGESAKVGISNYILKPNDLIEWKYGSTTF